tara:strand:+ start:109 stop:1272 length:1164 start_codon:yes stop_codon:yes gene_type:complete
MKSKLFSVCILFSLTYLSACGGGGVGTEPVKPDTSNIVLSITTPSALTLAENLDEVVQMQATKSAVVWSLTGTDSALLDVDYSYGYLTLKAAHDYENPIDDGKDHTYKFTVSAYDGESGTTDTKDMILTITNDDTERGTITTSSSFGVFPRYLDVRNLRIFVRPEVSNTFLESVASTFEAMLMNTSDIDYDKRGGFTNALNTLNAYQRIGSEGPSNYSGTMDATPGGGYTVNGIDYIWEETGKTEAEIIGEVIEHLLHTITTIGFNTSFVSEWFWNSTSSNVYLAMQQAINNGIYDISDYASLEASDPEGYRRTIVTEYAYWLILAEWDYFGVAGKVESGYGTGNAEFSVGTPAEISSKNPLGHQLYLTTVAKILSVPDKDVIRSLF